MHCPAPFIARLAAVALAFVLLATNLQVANAQQSDSIKKLEAWLELAERPAISEQAWAKQAISRKEADQATELLWADYQKRLTKSRKAEWDNKVIELNDRKMKFDFKTFGEADNDGRSLYISMHGGGSAPPRVNEQQWRNQIGLYKPKEGVYLAPRAPTDTWNLWHEPHIDQFFQRIIQDAVLFENVDPNRVYLMGYSAGGDGVYQLAPRMADRLAAAAMMAGHPNDASPLGLRNIGFTLHMGGNDSAYKRNEVAKQWKEKLAQLEESDPQGYRHEVTIHEGKGHWMDREDAVAVPWMAKFRRDPLPQTVVWHQSGVTHDQFYWLATAKPVAKSLIVASYKGDSIKIEKMEGTDTVTLLLNDNMMDLDSGFSISIKGKTPLVVEASRSIEILAKTLEQRGDKLLMFSAEVQLQGIE